MNRILFGLVLLQSLLSGSCLSPSEVPYIHGRDIRDRNAWNEVLANVVFLDYSSDCATDDGIFIHRQSASRESESCGLSVTNVGAFPVTLESYSWASTYGLFGFKDTSLGGWPKAFAKPDPAGTANSLAVTFPITLNPGDHIFCYITVHGNRGTDKKLEAQEGILSLEGSGGQKLLSIPLLTNATGP